MGDRDKRKVKENEEKDAVLRIAVTVAVILLVIGIIVVVVKVLNPKADTQKGLQKLKQMEQTDVAKVDKKIQKLEEAERQADEEWASRPASEKFANALVLGDSVTQGLSEFGILDAAYVQADRGTGVSEAADNKIEEHLAKAEELKPQVLFLAYGMNDIEATRGDAKAFAKTYKAVLDRLKESLPDTRIYINSILPVKQSVIDENEWYGNIDEYNKALKALCEKEDVTFIDNGSLVKEEYYTEDGIHMQPDYYTEWVNHMAEVAGL